MATYYWSGTGTWDNSSTANWYNGTGGTGGNAAAAPTSADTVILNAASGAGTCTVAATAACLSVTLTGYTGTLAFGAAGKITVTTPSTSTAVTADTTFTVTGADPLIEVYTTTGTVAVVMGAMTEANSISVTTFGAATKNLGGSFRNLSASGSLVNVARTIYGNLTFEAGSSWSGNGTTTTMAATSGTQTITTNGSVMQMGFVVNAPGATVELADAFDMGGPTRAFTLIAGTFTTNNHNFTVGTFASTGSTTRTLNLGSSLVTVLGASWNCLSATNLTLNAGTSTIFFASTAAKTMWPGTSLTYWNIKNGGGGAAALTIAGSAGSGSCSYNEWQADTLPCTYRVTNSYTQTLTNFPPSGSSVTGLFCIQSTVEGAQFTLSKASGTWNATNVYVRDCIFTGGATWNATNSVDGGNNTGGSILYTGVARYWVNGGSGIWDTSDTTNWSTDGITPGASAPGPGDYAYFPSGTTGTVTLGANVTVSKWETFGSPTFTFNFNGYKIITDWLGECFRTASTMTVYGGAAGGARVDMNYAASAGSIGPSVMRHGWATGTISEGNAISLHVTAGTALTGTPSRFRTLDCTGFTGALQDTFTRFCYGNWIMHSGMTPGGGTGVLTFGATSGVQEIYCGGATFNNPVTFNGVGGTFRFMDAFAMTSTRTMALTNGTLDANNFNVTFGTFSFVGATTRTINMGSGTWTVLGNGANAFAGQGSTNLTVNCGTSTILFTAATAKTISGAGKTWYNIVQGGAGALTINESNTFNDISASYLPSTITIVSGTTQTFANFSAAGILNDTLTINSSAAGTYTFVLVSGTVNSSYLNITNCIGSPVATWNATYSTQTTCTNWSTTNLATTYYWTGAVNGGTGTWDNSSTANWSLSSGGAGGAGYPLPADTVIFDASSGAGTCTIGATVNCKTLTMTGYTGTVAFGSNKIQIAGANATVYTSTANYTGTPRIDLVYPGRTGTRTLASSGAISEANSISVYVTAGIDSIAFTASHRWGTLSFTGFSGTVTNTAKTIYGSLILSPTIVAMGGNQTQTLSGSGSHTIDFAGCTVFAQALTLAGSGTYTLQSNVIIGTYGITLSAGTLDANGYNVTCSTLGTTTASVKTLTMGSGTWTLFAAGNNTLAISGTNLTVNKGTASIVLNGTTGNNTIYTNGFTFYRLVISKPGSITFTSNSIFDYIENTTFPIAIIINRSTPLTCNLGFDISGNSTNQSTLSSDAAGLIAYVSAPTGVVVNPEYLTITDVGAMGGAKWDTYGNTGNINGGNSPGWLWYQANVDHAAFMEFIA